VTRTVPATGKSTTTRFPVPVDAALRAAGWQPGRWVMAQAEAWADQLRAYTSPAGHRHAILPTAVAAWAEFGTLVITADGEPGLEVAPTGLLVDPLRALHLARTLADLGRALGTQLCPLGEECGGRAQLAIDAEGRVYAIDHAGDWYLGATFDQALATLITGIRPARLTI
jgi:hypothetical protein